VASNLDSIKKYGPEELNLAAVVDKQVLTEATVKTLVAYVGQILENQAASGQCDVSSGTGVQAMLTEMNNKINSINSTLCARLEHVQQACSVVAESHIRDNQQGSLSSNIDIDRKLNIVILGVCDNCDAQIWRSKVEDILQFGTGHSIDVADMYRL
jgi:hypothetical protein